MAETTLFEPGGYRYVRGRFQYSGGVSAEPGFVIERARFARPVPLVEGFRRIETYLDGLGRPPTAFCACELRSPGQFTEEGFIAFNRVYVRTLEGWGIFKDEENPVARSNVCPEVHPPDRTQLPCIFVHGTGRGERCGGAEELRNRGLRRSARRTRRVRGPDHPSRGHLARSNAGKGAVRPRSDGASDGGVGHDVGGRHHEPSLHGPRNPWVSRRRGRPPGCGTGRCHMDLRPAAGPRTGLLKWTSGVCRWSG